MGGVGGGIIAVLPGLLGIGVYSPLLDARGNSARSVAVCQQISRELDLHSLAPPRPATATVRARYSLAGLRSKRRPPATESRLLDAHSARAAVFELQGDLRFTTLEPVLRPVGRPLLFDKHTAPGHQRVDHRQRPPAALAVLVVVRPSAPMKVSLRAMLNCEESPWCAATHRRRGWAVPARPG